MAKQALIYAGPGVGPGRGDTVEALEARAKAAGFEVRRLVRVDWRPGRVRLETDEQRPVRFSRELLDSVDLLLVPGAGGRRWPYGTSNYAIGTLFNFAGYDPVLRAAVQSGLGYVGICAGAFFAANTGHRDMDLGSFKATWARGSGSGNVTVEAALPGGAATRLIVPLIGGPSFSLSELPAGHGVTSVATMRLRGGPALSGAVSFRVGQGHVFLCGPHPEALTGDRGWDAGDDTWRKDPQSVRNNYAFLEAWIRASARGAVELSTATAA